MKPFDISRIQPRAWKILSRSFETGRLASTYLIYGRPGTGHWALSISLAALVNCKDRRRDDNAGVSLPCGECPDCRRIFSLAHDALFCIVPLPPHKKPDEAIDLTNEILQIKRIEPFSIVASALNLNIPIDSAREVRQRLARIANPGETRVVLFYRMDRMRWASADALLKMIEEPPANTLIVLTSEKPELLPRTIQSRAQKVRLQPVNPQVSSEYLVTHCQASDKKAQLASRISDGSIGRAIELLSADGDSDGSQRAVWFLLYKALFTEESPQVVSRMLDLVDGRSQADVAGMLTLWQTLIRDCAGLAVDTDENAVVNADFLADIRKVPEQFRDVHVARLLTHEIKNALADLRLNTHIHGTLAALVLRLKQHLRSSSAA